MKISPNFYADDWKELTFSTESDWRKAVSIFEDRIRGRFINIIDQLIKLFPSTGGFAILALDCLLIETLQQFREGVKETPRYKSEEYFMKFFTTTSFRDFFNEEYSKIFYREFRCGILHQAEIKNASFVRNEKKYPLISPINDNTGIIIHRTLFHKKLVQVFEEYVSALKNQSNTDLRNNFRKKMNFICNAPDFSEQE